MKKKLLSLFTVSVVLLGLFAGCKSSSNNADNSQNGEKVKAGMVTDSGTIDDKSFNQGSWEGFLKSKEDFKTDIKFLQPAGETEADYLKEIGNLYDAGYKFIVTPGYKFESSIYKAQQKYKDASFVLLDGEPRSDAGEAVVGEKTVSIYFAEEQAGFVAGVAACVEIKDGDLGFIGGMKIPAVQRFNYGFQQGVAYANENLGTNIKLKSDNVLYQGTFTDAAAGQQLAAQMYDRGVKVIFCAGGAVGNGVITEAKNRVSSGEKVWVIGVDSDQYNDGIYDGNKSVVLTSAIKKIDTATYDMIKDFVEGNFKGGQILKFDVQNNGVGIPAENPNLSDGTMAEIEKLYEELKAGNITVSAEKGNLIE